MNLRAMSCFVDWQPSGEVGGEAATKRQRALSQVPVLLVGASGFEPPTPTVSRPISRTKQAKNGSNDADDPPERRMGFRGVTDPVPIESDNSEPDRRALMLALEAAAVAHDVDTVRRIVELLSERRGNC